MPLQFVKDNVNIDFIGKRRIGFLISALCIIASLAVMLAGSGLRMGIDFAGGVIAQVQFKDNIADETLKKGLEKYDLGQYFDTVVAVEDAENGKPAPDIVLNTMERLDSKPETSIMVGDSRLDILCAHNAGVPCELVGWSVTLAGKTKEDFAPGEAPDYIIQKPADLLDII